VHRHRPAAPEPFRTTLAPSRQDVVVWVACLFTWSGLAELWAPEGVPCGRGHARARPAIPGGKAKHAPLASPTIAVRRRGGRLPQASGAPAAMRATRDLLRRRLPRARTRAELLAHGQQTTSQAHLPAIGPKMAAQAHRDGVAARLADPAGPTRIAVALARSTDAAERRRAVARTRRKTANHHDAHPRARRHTGPGIGTILRLVWRDAIPAMHRFPTVPAVVPSGRRVTWAQASAGNRVGPAGPQSGHGQLRWAFAEAAVGFRRDHPPAPPDLARWERTHAQGNALTVLAHQLARAVYDRRKRQGACAQEPCFPHEWRGAEEPGASLDTQGMHRPDAFETAASRASWHAQARIGRETLSPARGLDLRSRSSRMRRESPTVDGGGPSPEPGANWPTVHVAPALCRGRDAGTETLRGRRTQA
jgi:hypothetical protein